MAIAFGFEWPLYFLTPLLTAFFLALPLPAPTLRQIFDNILYVLVAFAVGLVFTLFLLPYPLVYVAALGLVLFRIYYLANRGGPIFLILMSMLAVLILPMMVQAHEGLAMGFALYFVQSALLAIIIFALAHGVIPDPPGERPALPYGGFQRGYSRVAAMNALKSTIAILPLATLFIAGGWAGELLILVFAAIFSLTPEVSKGTATALKSLTSTLIGGFAAMVFYYLIVAVPEFHFFIALMLLTTLLFGMNIFSAKPIAKYLPSAFIALVILLGSSLGEDANFMGKFFMRVVLLSAAALYVVAALSTLNHFWLRKSPEA